jgi:hypothetical protein
MRSAHTNMTTDEQVAFAWEHRAHFAAVAEHNSRTNSERYRGNWDNQHRNAWAELAEATGAQ